MSDAVKERIGLLARLATGGVWIAAGAVKLPDPGASVAAVRAYDLLPEDQEAKLELLADLDRVPATGALVVATWPKPREGSGFPARVFAIVEREETRPTGD